MCRIGLLCQERPAQVGRHAGAARDPKQEVRQKRVVSVCDTTAGQTESARSRNRGTLSPTARSVQHASRYSAGVIPI